MRIAVEFSCFEDMDGDSYVSIEEFTERCMQLHGPARSADLFALRHQAVSWSRFRRFFFILYIISTLCPAHISPSERVQFGKSQNLNSFKMCFEVKMGAQLRHLEVELRKLKKQMDVGFNL